MDPATESRIDEMSQIEFEREFGDPGEFAEEWFSAFGGAGWTGEQIEEFEAACGPNYGETPR